MPLDIVVGTQWGDEGKGRFVDLLAADADYVARFNGGDNAGHTVTVGSQTFKLHLIPSGIIQPHSVGVIGNGVVVCPEILINEIKILLAAGVEITPQRLQISYGAHLITPAHIALDKAQEQARGKTMIGTTLRGIGPAYTSKVSRAGIRFLDMLDAGNFETRINRHVTEVNDHLTKLYQAEPINPKRVIDDLCQYSDEITPYISDVSSLLTGALKQGRRVLAEGAQGTLLDLDHGTYPFVTSSTPTAGGALVGLGIGMGYGDRVIGVTKSFQTRVGSGPFPTELEGDLAHKLRGTGEQPWDEFGTTTGRPRRVGWLDLVLLRYAARINGINELALTKLDILSGFDQLFICTGYRKDNQTHLELPFGPGNLDGFDPIYEEFPGWEQDLTSVRKWEELPAAARSYVLSIEQLIGVKIKLISVGPEREQVIEKN
ncbi:MAG: adenylosuccinate synthase [Anaerolineales bacterium]|jgi:adenylosuccinate synthase